MDLRQLRYFVAIVEGGSLSKAAQTLRIAQPALSQHLRNMEEELGVTLLHRTHRGALPTPAGARLMRLATTIIAEFQTMRDVVRGADNLPAGHVELGLPGTISELLGVPLIETIRTRLPSVHLRVREAMSGFLVDWLRDGDLELAILHGVREARGLKVRHVLTEELCLFGAPALRGDVAAEGAAVRLASVAGLPLILPSASQGLRAAIESCAAQAGVSLAAAIEVDSYAQLKLLAMRGLGFGILPVAVVSRQVAAGQLASWRIVEPAIRRDVVLAHAAARPLSSAARAVAELTWTVMRDLVQSGLWSATLAEEADPSDQATPDLRVPGRAGRSVARIEADAIRSRP